MINLLLASLPGPLSKACRLGSRLAGKGSNNVKNPTDNSPQPGRVNVTPAPVGRAAHAPEAIRRFRDIERRSGEII